MGVLHEAEPTPILNVECRRFAWGLVPPNASGPFGGTFGAATARRQASPPYPHAR
jgi:hypothetical protein